MKDQKLNIYDEITQKIISAIEDGVAPWRKSWNSVNLGPFRNAVTNRPYRGINTLLLSLSAFSKGFFDPRWLTFNKASELGGRVRKGERGTTIVFWKFLERKENVDEIHYTKHPTRLNRDFRLRFKTEQEARAMEELVAEIGAAFLESHARVPFEGMQHPEYIHSWLEVLKGDNRAIFTAAAKAQAAADYVLEQAGISTEAEKEMLEAINT